jgi:dual specificity MAP kinase phosphatase
MSRASEISKNVFLGPTPDPLLLPWTVDAPAFDIHIECSDVGHLPDSKYLREMRSYLDNSKHQPLHMEFTSSGSILPPTWSQVEVDSLMEMCRWIYEIANADDLDTAPIRKDSVGDILMMNKGLRPQKILIHCTDGYTETSLLALAYYMYAEGVPVHEAWAQLHREKGRNFFAYPSDVSLLRAIQPRILQESPKYDGDFGSISSINEPAWLPKIDGSLPSRILPYMYLGNLNHANNPLLLRELGITRVLSVGEPVSWSKDTIDEWGEENLLFIDRVQDNGVDSLTEEFERCLSFIGALPYSNILSGCLRVGLTAPYRTREAG